jgi:hypothetical protein
MQITAPAPEPIFSYFDGIQIVKADPWPLHRDIYRRTHGQPNLLTRPIYAMCGKPATEDSPAIPEPTDIPTIMAGYEAMDQLEALVRTVFKMQTFIPATGQGAQWPHCFAVWEQFATYMSEQVKKNATMPNSISPSDSPTISAPATPTGSA